MFVLKRFIKEIRTELDFLDILLDWAANVCNVTYSEESSTLPVVMT